MELLIVILTIIPFIGLALDSRDAEEYDEMGDSDAPQEYYIEAVEIAKAKDVSGVDGEHHFERDTAILMELNKEGLDFNPELYIGGNFKCDWDAHDGIGSPPRVKPLEWGSNFKVDELSSRAGLKPLFDQSREDNVIRDEVLQGLIGQTIVYLRYIYGHKNEDQLGYSNYDRVRFPKNFKEAAKNHLESEGAEINRQTMSEKCVELAKQSLEDSFLDDVNAGYIDDFDPSVIEDGEEYGQEEYSGDGAPADTEPAEAPKGDGWDDEEDTFAPDDDLPF